jgi:flagellar hook assembly protein FlgD
VAGRLVRRLVEGTLTAGEHVVKWDGQDDNARPVASGVYVYRLAAPGANLSRRMALVR